MQKTSFIAAILFCVWPALAGAQSVGGPITNLEGEVIGNVRITPAASNILFISISAENVPPGMHAVHFHSKGKCEPQNNFRTAGRHISGSATHGVLTPSGPHPGDLPNVHVGSDGILRGEFFNDILSVSSGVYPLLDSDGSSLVIHAGEDDHATEPEGASGAAFACAVIKRIP